MKDRELKLLFDRLVTRFNTPQFIPGDPVSIPHLFSKKQDIEIAGLFAATLAWGQRTTIINNCRKLMQWMDNAPHDFVLNHTERDLKPFLGFAHRTFNDTDTLYFIYFLKHYYLAHSSLETAFTANLGDADETIEGALSGFQEIFFNNENAPPRTRKHVSTPLRKSACKRLCMYLRWMVRRDANGVDFGLWKGIAPRQLICPLDLHVERIAREFNLITRKQPDWACALELTSRLRRLDPTDPVKYDFALFGLSISRNERIKE
jgi:uncharacterized protein (TIGR02757 family)